jgi:hypothetical protein
MRARRRQGEDQRDTLAKAAILPSSMTFRATERSREAITLRREAVRFIGGNGRALRHRLKMICAPKHPTIETCQAAVFALIIDVARSMWISKMQ